MSKNLITSESKFKTFSFFLRIRIIAYIGVGGIPWSMVIKKQKKVPFIGLLSRYGFV
jgi:hypothetical protein